jgi:hypothetical protein
MSAGTLRRRLLFALESVTIEELAAALAVVQMISTRNDKGAGEAITPQPAKEQICKTLSHYSTPQDARN